ncbi:DUF4123 domain-containing protein [Entomomonas sp. E2T0]|uniref:DUF4123 domain-containing protein n=1 Tax=Entomomonas sp. E2T0 TaxID=2930213 RepID=UPI0022282E02|nr:DUF4123 domain-containing protein [Entomomonas sp. E2T0]UYZ85367.1 DUF4123 domain-containing protein [Entomomonas sp. E2T0]
MQNTPQDLTENYRQAIQKLPWHTHQITLLLDGINVPNILRLIHANNAIKQFSVLYIQTRFQELKEVSPCLIKLDSSTSYPIEKFLENINNEWGYFLASQSTWEEQVQYLKSLLVVEDALTEQQMLLKIADPQVMAALLSTSIEEQDTTLFGPFTNMLAANVIDKQINYLQRPNQQLIPLSIPYKLTEKQAKALDQVDIKRANQQIYAHMQTYFPEFLTGYGSDYKKEIDLIISQAEQFGYTSVKEQLYYLNIHGYLGVNALQENAQLASLVKAKNIESLKDAAQLAKQLSEDKGIAV